MSPPTAHRIRPSWKELADTQRTEPTKGHSMTILSTPVPTPTTDDDAPQSCGETYIRLMRAIAQDDPPTTTP